jgi:hypothetical protein
VRGPPTNIFLETASRPPSTDHYLSEPTGIASGLSPASNPTGRAPNLPRGLLRVRRARPVHSAANAAPSEPSHERTPIKSPPSREPERVDGVVDRRDRGTNAPCVARRSWGNRHGAAVALDSRGLWICERQGPGRRERRHRWRFGQRSPELHPGTRELLRKGLRHRGQRHHRQSAGRDLPLHEHHGGVPRVPRRRRGLGELLQRRLCRESSGVWRMQL